MSLGEEFALATRQKARLGEWLAQIEQSPDTDTAAFEAELKEFRKSVLVISSLAVREPAEQREEWRRRGRALEEECLELEASLSRYVRSQRQRTEAAARAALLGEARENGKSAAVDHALRDNSSLVRSRAIIQDTIGMAREALRSLNEQGGVFKQFTRKVLDVSNSLGLSTSVIGAIDRRSRADRWLVYGLMLLTTLVLVLLVWWVRRR